MIMKSYRSFRRGLPQFCVAIVMDLIFFGWGLILGYPTILIPGLQAKNKNAEQQLELSIDAFSWLGSIMPLFVPIGSIIAARLMDVIGKKRIMQLVNLPFLAAWALIYFSTNLIEMYIALALMGIGGGLLEGTLVLYIAETIEPRFRGMLTASGTVIGSGGICVQFFTATWVHWKKAAAISAIIPFVAMLVACFVPETPPWLCARDRFEDAKKSMQFLRGWVTFDEVEDEFRAIAEAVAKDKIRTRRYEENNFCVKLTVFSKRSFLAPFSLVLALFIFVHFSGITPLATYAVFIFNAYKVPINEYYATAILGFAQLIGCALGMVAVKLIGKRPLALISYLGCAVCFFAVTIVVNLIKAESDSLLRWIPFGLLLIGCIFSASGAKILPGMLNGEVFTIDVRSTAASMSSAFGYILAFVVNKLFLSMVATFTLNGTFWFYSAVGLVAAIVLYFPLPETEGKTLQDVQAIFDKSTNSNEIERYQDKKRLIKRVSNTSIQNYGSVRKSSIRKSSVTNGLLAVE